MSNKQDIFTVHYSGTWGQYYDFNIDAEETDISTSNNQSTILVRCFVRRNNSSYSAYNNNGTEWTMTINGTKYSGTSTWDCTSDGWKKLGEKTVTITHDNDGTKTITISGTHTGNSASGASKMGNASGSGTYKLTNIARGFTSKPSLSVSSKKCNSVTLSWSTSENASVSQYKIGSDGSWVDVETNINKKSGTMTVSGLSPNTSYTFYGDWKRQDTGRWATSDYTTSVSVTTPDIARISTYSSSLNLGDTYTIKYNNSSGYGANVGIYGTDASTEYAAYRAVSDGTYTFTFTDAELDKMYKAMGTGTSLTCRLYLNTNSNSWRESKDITIKLTGNQKTAKTNVSGTWRRGKYWVNVDGTWRRGVVWTNVDGTWRRGI